MITFAFQMRWILSAIRCQTSPDFATLRYHNPEKRLALDFAGDGGFLHWLSSALLFWQSDVGSCLAVDMIPEGPDSFEFMGSLSLLWPLFLSLCLSQFIETLACALQGRQPMPETGMTIFEHSLAFAEAEALLTNTLGLGFFGPSKASTTHIPSAAQGGSTSAFKLTRSMVLHRLNVPPEVLLVSLISTLSHLSSNTLAVLGLRSRFRLINTGIWALLYMSAFIWSLLRLVDSSNAADEIGILRFPTVCIVGFIPHLLILIGIFACASIYGLALLLTAFSLPPGAGTSSSVKERLVLAYQNLQANVHLSNSTPITLNWHDDFYTALLKAGFTILTAASEAVYLNEGTQIRVSPLTWLEEKRIEEIAQQQALLQRSINAVPAELRQGFVADGISSTDQPCVLSRYTQSSHGAGYLCERKTRSTDSTSELSRNAARDSGVGLLQRRGRWTMTIEFAKGIFWLCLSFIARGISAALRKLGITYRPDWLSRLTGNRTERLKETVRDSSRSGMLDFWMLSDDGTLSLPADTNVDVEVEIRRRLDRSGQISLRPDETEEAVSANLYSWWKSGGWWGDVDTSGDYQTPDRDDDDDTTSLVSRTTEVDEEDVWSDISGDGDRTPTGLRSFSRETTPADGGPLDISSLTSLLDPKTADQQHEASILGRHLRSQGILTRAQYRREIAKDKASLLRSSRHYLPGAQGTSGMPVTPEEEERVLEQFILNQRGAKSKSSKEGGAAWDHGAAGMGSGGPQCVVCQSRPRTILIWPCGCLSLCDDCRVGLAARNYATCVCCRTDVVAYSRLYVP